MVFPIAGGTQLTGDFVTNSLRLNDDDSPYLERSLSSPNTDKFTVSCWVKLSGARSQIANIGKRLTGEAGDNRSIDIEQGSTGRLGISAYNGVADSNVAAYNSNTGAGALIRDPSAWYHFVYAFDTGQGTAANRFKWYINGVLQSGYNTTTTPSQNADLFDSSGSGFRLGRAYNTESRYSDMYVAEYYYVDGQQYDHTYFGKFDDNGVWVPVKNGQGAGGAITFGTNGFYLQFKETGTSANASGIGADTSGNDNHLTPNNLAALDITTDTPQNNFATLNPLIGNSGITYSEGNLQFSQYYNTASTIAVENGKWYLEMKILNDNTYNPNIGIAQTYTILATEDVNNYHGNVTDSYGISREGNLFANGSNIGSQGFTLAQNDIVGVALDLDSGTKTIKWYKNGSQVATRNLSETRSEPYVFGTYASSSQAGQGSFNFGNPAFSISSGNADANGYGNFEYAPPSGYYALCTKNFAEFG